MIDIGSSIHGVFLRNRLYLGHTGVSQVILWLIFESGIQVHKRIQVCNGLVG